MLPEFEYLKKLLNESYTIRRKYQCAEIDETNADISYLAMKNRLELGLKSGLSNILDLQKYRLKEQKALRSSTKSWQRILCINQNK